MKSDSPICRTKAFSLVEVLVATVILVLIVTLLAGVAFHVSEIWRSAEALNQRRSTGRALLQFIVRDLEMARLPHSYPRDNRPNLQFVVSDPALIPANRLNPHAAFWQAPVAVNREKGDLAMVGYFVKWETTASPDTAKAQLCRFLVDPEEANHYLIYNTASSGHWLNAATIDAVAPASSSDEYRGWFADNVIALWIRCLDGEGNPITHTASGINSGFAFDSQKGYSASGKIRPAPALPASVEVALITIDTRTANLITSPLHAVPSAPADLWKGEETPGSIAHFIANLPPAIRPGVQLFSTRVFLKNAQP